MKKLLKFLTGRLFISILFVLLQITVIFYFTVTFAWGYRFLILSSLIGFILAIAITGNDANPSYKIAWILTIFALPVFGILMYLIFGNKKLGRWGQRKIRPYKEICYNVRARDLPRNENPSKVDDPYFRKQIEYISSVADYDAFTFTKSTYFALGDDVFPVIMEKLEEAKRFVMMEFFIYEEGEMWNRCLQVLRRKIAQGVLVFVMYDDMGSISTLPKRYDRQLERMGIHAVKFNPVRPRLNSRLNYRDHRKIMVIDGDIAFNGGINFADEYINRKIRFGHWKDTVIMLEGSAVWNFTLMFIQLWSFSKNDENAMKDVQKFFPTKKCQTDGLVLPFGDSPLDNHNVSENVYMQMINMAASYVWITTPYLILDNEMITSLSIAAESGIDVRIITPRFPDKKIVLSVTRSNYRRLVQHGVKIYEYTPGFIHSKTFISDDKMAIVGTTNMDYRSFYLHFECGTLLCGCSCISDIKKDYERTLQLSKQVTNEDIMNVSPIKRVFRSIMQWIAPLL